VLISYCLPPQRSPMPPKLAPLPGLHERRLPPCHSVPPLSPTAATKSLSATNCTRCPSCRSSFMASIFRPYLEYW